jgi:hypothetical protein
VAKQLQDSFPWLVSVACAAHRLALSSKDASSNVPYMATFRDHLQQLHLYFRNSANRTSVLKSAAQTLGLADLKVKASYAERKAKKQKMGFMLSSHEKIIFFRR